MTVEDAAREWVREMNAYPTDMLRIVQEADPEDWTEFNQEQGCWESFADFPMWSFMWSFSDSADEYWLVDLDNFSKMSDCGFSIYRSEQFGYFFGINGAGYNFYKAHWIPLYRVRGLCWHDLE